MMLLTAGITAVRASESFYPLRPEDPQAVYATQESVGAIGDGIADDSLALQRAIDRVQETTRRGIVFIPTGRYRLTKTLRVWSGIRLIGYGAERPVLVLGEVTAGFAEGEGKYLVHFVSDRPESPDQPVRDANPGTFYSAMSNIDIEIQRGNPAAIGVRSHYAQHCFLAHIDFRIGDGRAGVEEVGNESEDLHFYGGEFGIITHKPSPSWPFLLIDSSFDGQRRAAIETEEAGLTMIRVDVKNVPTAVLVRQNRAEELWIKDSRFGNISGPALVISDERSARTQINAQNVVCTKVPFFAQFRESGKMVAGPGNIYVVKEFSHGLHIADVGATAEITTKFEAELLTVESPPTPTDIAKLPPMETWVNVCSLGLVGDGRTDNTAALRAAIATRRPLYFPSGRYRVTDTITLRPETVLIGLNPITTQVFISDFAPAFQGVNGPLERPASPRSAFSKYPPFAGKGAPKPMIEAPRGGVNIITGIGLDTGGINNRAVALKWMAGVNSLVNDVRFLGGHGTYGPDGRYLTIYNENRTGDTDDARRWDSQYWSLWVTDGGGGTFKDIWTPSPFAAAGLYISDTATPGRVYALSSEHHVRNEVKLRNVSNWEFYALQTEEEKGESAQALPMEIDNCANLTVGNFFIYRVDMNTPFETGIRVTASRILDFRGLHAYSPGKLTFDNTLVDQTHDRRIRAREIAWLHLSGDAPTTRVVEDRVEKVAGGFGNIDGAATDASGNVYFVDQPWQRIYCWSSHGGGLRLVTDSIPQPVALAIDRDGQLLIVSRHGNVYALKPGANEADIVVLSPEKAMTQDNVVAWLPTNRWRDGHDWIEATTRREPIVYRLPDGAVFIPAPENFTELAKPGRAWRLGTVDLARTYQLAPARVGEPFYVSDEFSQKIWRFTMGKNGALGSPQLFAEEGEAGTTVDDAGNVYVCAGQVFVYDSTGKQIEVIEIPERPSAVAFGGPNRRTLFVAARSSLYTVRSRDGRR